MSAPTPITAASAQMLTVSAGSDSVGTSNYAPIWLSKQFGKKSVDCFPIQSGYSREYRRRFLQEQQAPDELSQLEARTSRLRQGIARLIDSYAEGLIDKDEFEPRVTRMRERLKQIEEQALQLKDEASLERELRLILGRLDEFASRVKQGLDQADWSTRRDIIRALVKRVEVDQEQVRVVFRVNPPPGALQPPSEKYPQSLQHCGGRAESNTFKHPSGQTGHLC